MTRLGSSAEVMKQGRYGRVLGTLWRHRKTSEVGDAALGLLLRIWSYCADQGCERLTEQQMLDLFRHNPNARRQLNQLVAAGFIDRLPGGGYAPHDWSECNRVTKPAKLRLVKAAPKEAPARGREEPVMDLRGRCDEDVMTTPPEIVQESPSPRACARSQDPGPILNSPSESSVDAPAPPPQEPPKLREVRQQIRDLEARYDDPELLAEVRQGCANTRKGGQMADTLWRTTLLKLAMVERGAVLGAMHEYVERYADGSRGEGYLVAVAKNKAKRGDQLRRTRPTETKIREEDGNAEEIIALLESFTREAS